MKKILTPRFLTLAGILLMAVLSRLLPHPDNFTPLAALALFGGATFSRRSVAFALLMGVLLISDLCMEVFYGYGLYPGMWVNYLAFASIVAIGLLLRSERSVPAIALGAIAGSVWFFLLSNFGTWLASGMYAHTFEGLVQCYTMGLPFFRNTFIGDLVYTTMFFGGFALARRSFPAFNGEQTTVNA
jgi:hypothetical protein